MASVVNIVEYNDYRLTFQTVTLQIYALNFAKIMTRKVNFKAAKKLDRFFVGFFIIWSWRF